MELDHVTDRLKLNGTIDDVFRKFVAEGHPRLQCIVDLLPVLRSSIAGPRAWACESHGQLFIMPYDRPDGGNDPNHDRFAQIQVSGYSAARHAEYTIYYDIPKSEWTVPIYTRKLLSAQGCVQAAMAVVHGLNSVFTIFDPTIAKHTIVNNNEPMKWRQVSWNEYFCPHCHLSFSVENKSTWNGKRHIPCGQELTE